MLGRDVYVLGVGMSRFGASGLTLGDRIFEAGIEALEGAKRNVKANAIAPAASPRMTQALAGELAATLQPELVSPLVAYLCHRSLEHSGQVISVGGGRLARVAIGVSPGVATAEPMPDFVAENLDAVLSEAELIFPANAMEEIALLMQVTG